MLSLDFVYLHPDIVQEALRRRQDGRSIEDILRLSEQRRGLLRRNDGLYVSLRNLRETVRTGSLEQRAELNPQIKATIQEIRQLEIQLADLNTRLQMQLQSLPNLPHKSVPEGVSAADNRIVQSWGEPLTFFFTAQAHWKLGEDLGLIDVERGSKIAGSRFVVLKGQVARLERALISFMLDVHTREHGYTEILPPQLVKRSVMLGAGQLPKFEDQVYACTEDELYLNPTAEIPLVGMHSDETLSSDELPVRYVAWTTAYRREVGSTSSRTRGLLRLHQFNKVELFQLVSPQDSYPVLQQMVQHAEVILQRLELHYRVVELCTGKLPFAASQTFDLEVWMPGQERYVEVSSISNCEEFQARRANIKHRPSSNGRAGYVHSLNGSGLAVGRTMAAILETYQQADGSVIIPKVLRPYVGNSLLVPAP